MVIVLDSPVLLHNRVRWLIPIVCLLISSVACIRASINVQGIRIEEIVMSHFVDENEGPIDNVNVFQPDTERIYCLVKVPDLANDKLQIQWYFEDTLISETESVVSAQGQVAWFLERPSDNLLFPEGQYHVEINYKTVQLDSKRFRVEK